MNRSFLTRPIGNSPLIIFRIILGLLISLECFGAIATGWVRTTLVEPQFTFNFIGFDWLQVLVGPQMYVYFILMGILGICIMIGYRYRLSMVLFTLMWAGAYLLQKSAYNNHYYLLILISFMMCFFPAEHGYSLDVKRKPHLASDHMPAYVKWFFIAQLFIVYTYAGMAKLYGDWLDLSFIEMLLKPKADYPLIGDLLQTQYMHKTVAVYGVLFDLLVIPALLWKRTRMPAVIFSFIFHLFNSLVFQIGIFPYLSLGFLVFFFEPQQIRKTFFPKGKKPALAQANQSSPGKVFMIFWVIYFILQIVLPIRHYFIAGDVLWTEEGHRMSWRMMLRGRSGSMQYIVKDKATGSRTLVNPTAYLTPKQQNRVAAYPDFIWQFAQRLKKEYQAEGKDVAIYARSRIRVNSHPPADFIDSSVDLARESWDPFRHHNWILCSPLNTPKSQSSE